IERRPRRARGGDAERQLPARGELPERERRRREDEPHAAPGAHALVEEKDELLARRDVRFFLSVIEQFVLREAPDELEVVERELADQDLLEVAARRDIRVAAERQLARRELARRQRERAHELLDERDRGGEPRPPRYA